MVNAVEFLRHHVPANSQIHYIISNGGATPSVVPAFAEVNLGANHPDALILDEIWKRILKCAQAGALATETRVEVEQGQNYSNILPNDALTALVGRNMRKAGGYVYNSQEKQFAEELKKTLSASATQQNPDVVSIDSSEGSSPYASDVGDVSWNLPTVNFLAATFVPGTAAHSWQAAACAGSSIGRKGMLVAARTLALSAIDLLEHPAEIDAAKSSFEKRRGERHWITRIPQDAKPSLDQAGN
jgi:aminobenzoyl-glutamate utilization protein B